jgi:hypothetical protein
MQVSHRWKAVPFAALLASTSFVSARADEKPRTLQDFLGQEHAALSQAHSLASSPPLPPGSSAADRFRFWNRIAVDASGRDHTPVGPGETRVYGEQLGPGRSSRAMAIVHIAIYDAVNSILGGYESYTNIPKARPGASVDAAIAQAAHDTLTGVFKSQAPLLGGLLAEDLARIQATPLAKARGIATGRAAAKQLQDANYYLGLVRVRQSSSRINPVGGVRPGALRVLALRILLLSTLLRWIALRRAACHDVSFTSAFQPFR